MPYETRRRTTPQRSRGYKKRSIRPSFGNRNEIAKPLNWQQPPAPVVRLWESLQPFFFSLLKRRPLFLSYNLQRSHVLMVLKPSPPRVLLSVSLLNAALVTFFRGYNTSLWQDFCHVPRPKKVLFFVCVLRSLGGEKRSRSIGHQHHRHRSLTWTWTPTITCTHLYIYIFIYIYTCTASSRAMPVFQYITKAKQKAHWNRTVDGWSPAWMGATFCCMNTISQLGEGELDIASGTLTGKKKCKDQTDTNSNVWICFCTLLEMCLWEKKKSHRCVIYSGSQDQTFWCVSTAEAHFCQVTRILMYFWITLRL